MRYHFGANTSDGSGQRDDQMARSTPFIGPRGLGAQHEGLIVNSLAVEDKTAGDRVIHLKSMRGHAFCS